MASIYKNKQAKESLMQLYDQKLKSLGVPYQNLDIESPFGRTRVVKAGHFDGTPIAVFHGYNAGAPITLEALGHLMDHYCIYVLETPGQATKSEERPIPIKDDSFARWADAVLDALHLPTVHAIGISYGAFILEKMMTHRAHRLQKCILVVPSGIVRGDLWESTKRLTLPLIRWNITKKEKHLRAFLDAFVPVEDPFLYTMLSTIVRGVKLDKRIPAILNIKDVAHLKSPVYIIASDKDIYFPGDKIRQRSQTLFPHLKEVYLLDDMKHMPSKESYPLIQDKIHTWMQQKD